MILTGVPQMDLLKDRNLQKIHRKNEKYHLSQKGGFSFLKFTISFFSSKFSLITSANFDKCFHFSLHCFQHSSHFFKRLRACPPFIDVMSYHTAFSSVSISSANSVTKGFKFLLYCWFSHTDLNKIIIIKISVRKKIKR